MKASIHMIPIESLEINFFFNQENKPTVEANHQVYTSLAALFRDFPVLSHPQHKEKVSQLVNFLLKGLEFQYIENIEEFKEDYYQKIEVELISLDDQPLHLSDYGIYNVSLIHEPLIKDGRLIFFVKNEYNQLPYKVSVVFPVTTEPPQASYELLPFL